MYANQIDISWPEREKLFRNQNLRFAYDFLSPPSSFWFYFRPSKSALYEVKQILIRLYHASAASYVCK